MQGLLLNTIVFNVSSLCLLTQFIRSQGLLFLDVISWILLLKKEHFIFLIVLLKFFQLEIDFETQYASSLSLHLLFHHSLECLVIQTHFTCFLHIKSEIFAKFLTIIFQVWISWILEVLMLSIAVLRLLMNSFSSLLLLLIKSYFSWMNSSWIAMFTTSSAWLDKILKFGRIK